MIESGPGKNGQSSIIYIFNNLEGLAKRVGNRFVERQWKLYRNIKSKLNHNSITLGTSHHGKKIQIKLVKKITNFITAVRAGS